MISVSRSLCWAGTLILLALGNYLGLVSDQSAATMFAVIPALWVATAMRRNRCLPERRA